MNLDTAEPPLGLVAEPLSGQAGRAVQWAVGRPDWKRELIWIWSVREEFTNVGIH